eukprot:TRINITY_DN17836_c0_g1_i1.p1 TRINITY_DN17836_c0_g1~~TRINITY_DN17836_c0_g1_i1.p1  ORF type:complete len:113 (+),score=17.93 TRINITY_DN17836_c0_g1_i1:379-717(+)
MIFQQKIINIKNKTNGITPKLILNPTTLQTRNRKRSLIKMHLFKTDFSSRYLVLQKKRDIYAGWTLEMLHENYIKFKKSKGQTEIKQAFKGCLEGIWFTQNLYPFLWHFQTK